MQANAFPSPCIYGDSEVFLPPDSPDEWGTNSHYSSVLCVLKYEKCDTLWSFPPIFAIRGPLTQNFCDMMRLCATYENISLSCLSSSISYCCFGVLPASPLYRRQEYKNSIKPGKHCKEWVTVYWWPPGEKKGIVWIHLAYSPSEPIPSCAPLPGATYFVHLELWPLHGCLAWLEELHDFYGALKVWNTVCLKIALKELLCHKARRVHTGAGLLPKARLGPFARPRPAFWMEALQRESPRV